jgi:hypothetical protein
MLLTVNAFLTRARSAAPLRIPYRLGAGGMDPASKTPADKNGCDCSGFVCWALGISRQTTHPLYQRFNGGWINTDAMVHDANNQTGLFRKLDKPVVGAIVVYPSFRPSRKVGHVGIVTRLNADGSVARVLHCSSGSWRRLGNSIAETTFDVFRKPDTIYAWYEGLEA